MKLNVNIETDEYCNILITDNTNYLNETSTSIDPTSFKYSDTVSIISITHSDEREDKLKYYHVNKHTTKSFKIPITFDGIFTINFTVIPTKKWYDNMLKKYSKEHLLLMYGEKIYIYNETNIIEVNTVGEEYISIEDLVKTAEGYIESGYYDNLSISTKNSKLLSICKLRKCYVNLCLQIFNNKNFSPCWNKNKIDSELIYKRDLVWMAINIITYLWKLDNNNSEILRILDQVNSCNGLCDPYPSNHINESQNGCGCSGR